MFTQSGLERKLKFSTSFSINFLATIVQGNIGVVASIFLESLFDFATWSLSLLVCKNMAFASASL
jgi:hypothetical protein